MKPDDVTKLDHDLKLGGRIDRDGWVQQARELGLGRLTPRPGGNGRTRPCDRVAGLFRRASAGGLTFLKPGPRFAR